ncbi:MAG: hypothetical protein QG639_1040 [Patescibacteria group bacterium]|nr:hypothetical protein [Patescibacteria group bacterium]
MAAATPWLQTDWSGGSGQVTWSASDEYSSSLNITDSSTGQISTAQGQNWYNTAWKYRKTITIDNTKVSGSSDLSNFPVLVKLNDGDLSSNAQADGDDILFTNAAGTKLSHEIETYANSTGELSAWVLVPTLAGASDTTLYMYYGNSAATNQQDVVDGTNDVFGTDYAGVWHMHNAPAHNGIQQDSTNNNRDGTFFDVDGDSNTSAAGISGTAYTFAGDADSVQLSDFDFTNAPLTLSAWIRTTSTANQRILSKGINAQWLMTLGGVSQKYDAGVNDGAAWGGAELFTTYADNQWHYTAITFTPTNAQLFADLLASSLGTHDNSWPTNNVRWYIGQQGTGAEYFNGSIDEPRIRTVALSQDWFITEYNNQGSPATFYSVSAQEPQYPTTSTLTSSIFDTEYSSNWGTLSYDATTPSGTSVAVKVRTSNSSTMSGAPDFSSCDAVASGSDISSNNCVTDTDRYIQYQVIFTSTDPTTTATFNDISIGFEVILPTPTPSPVVTSSNTNSDTSSSSSTDNECTEEKPTSAPDLFQNSATTTAATLYFSPVRSATGYVVSYGLDQQAEQFGATIDTSNTSGVNAYTINDLNSGTTYYVKISGKNGCAAGDWSQTVKLTTTSISNPVINLFDQISEDLLKKEIAFESTKVEPVKVSSCEYEVKSGDTLWNLAEQMLGDGTRYTEIVEENSDEYPNLEMNMAVGTLLKIGCEKSNSVTNLNDQEQDGHILEVLIQNEGKPLVGAVVELHSTPQTSTTDENGVARFSNVEKGEHTLKIAYENFKGEEKININADEKEVAVSVEVTLEDNGFQSPSVQMVIGILVIVILALMSTIFLLKRKKINSA